MSVQKESEPVKPPRQDRGQYTDRKLKKWVAAANSLPARGQAEEPSSEQRLKSVRDCHTLPVKPGAGANSVVLYITPPLLLECQELSKTYWGGTIPSWFDSVFQWFIKILHCCNIAHFCVEDLNQSQSTPRNIRKGPNDSRRNPRGL